MKLQVDMLTDDQKLEIVILMDSKPLIYAINYLRLHQSSLNVKQAVTWMFNIYKEIQEVEHSKKKDFDL